MYKLYYLWLDTSPSSYDVPIFQGSLEECLERSGLQLEDFDEEDCDEDCDEDCILYAPVYEYTGNGSVKDTDFCWVITKD